MFVGTRHGNWAHGKDSLCWCCRAGECVSVSEDAGWKGRVFEPRSNSLQSQSGVVELSKETEQQLLQATSGKVD